MMLKFLVFAAIAGAGEAFAPSTTGHALVAARPGNALTAFAPAERRTAVVLMAVPKKRQSKMKTRQRKANWYRRRRPKGPSARDATACGLRGGGRAPPRTADRLGASSESSPGPPSSIRFIVGSPRRTSSESAR